METSIAIFGGFLLVVAICLLTIVRELRKEIRSRKAEYKFRIDQAEKFFESRVIVINEGWQSRERIWVDESRRREKELVDKIVEYAGKPPVIIDPSEAVRSIGEAISRITQGPESVLSEQTRLKQQVAENWEAAMKNAGEPGAGVNFVPFADSDPWMDSEAAREEGIERPIVAVVNEIVNGNGKRNAEDSKFFTGRPIEFRAGEGGAAPVGGWE